MGNDQDIGMNRRDALTKMGSGLVGLTISTGFGGVTPAEARIKGVPFRHLSAFDGRLLEAFGDVLLPGAAEAGIVHYVDDQLGRAVSQAGKKVVVLEAGPARTTQDMISSQLWARRLKWSRPPSETLGADPIAVTFGSGWGAGGAAVHHYAVWLRRHQDDFDMFSRFGVGLDWPISYDELRPYYDRIQREVGISGDAEAEVWRPPGEPYPMPPLKLFGQAMLR